MYQPLRKLREEEKPNSLKSSTMLKWQYPCKKLKWKDWRQPSSLLTASVPSLMITCYMPKTQLISTMTQRTREWTSTTTSRLWLKSYTLIIKDTSSRETPYIQTSVNWICHLRLGSKNIMLTIRLTEMRRTPCNRVTMRDMELCNRSMIPQQLSLKLIEKMLDKLFPLIMSIWS